MEKSTIKLLGNKDIFCGVVVGALFIRMEMKLILRIFV